MIPFVLTINRNC